MPIDLVIDEREGAGSTTSKSPENPEPTDLQDPVSLVLHFQGNFVCSSHQIGFAVKFWCESSCKQLVSWSL